MEARQHHDSCGSEYFMLLCTLTECSISDHPCFRVAVGTVVQTVVDPSYLPFRFFDSRLFSIAVAFSSHCTAYLDKSYQQCKGCCAVGGVNTSPSPLLLKLRKQTALILFSAKIFLAFKLQVIYTQHWKKVPPMKTVTRKGHPYKSQQLFELRYYMNKLPAIRINQRIYTIWNL